LCEQQICLQPMLAFALPGQLGGCCGWGRWGAASGWLGGWMSGAAVMAQTHWQRHGQPKAARG